MRSTLADSAPAGHRSWRARALPCLLVLAAALLSHARTLGNGFVFDDAFAVRGNPVVTGPLSAGRVLSTDYWGRPRGEGPGTWRPLAVLDLWIDWHAAAGRPWAFHLHNLLWHALACLLLWVGLRRRGAPPRFAALAAGGFAVLAVCTEAVAAVVGRADLMATALTLGAWAALPKAQSPRPGLRALAPAGLLFFGALLCKESALAALLWIPLADALLVPPLGRDLRALARRLVPLGVAALAALALRWALFAPPGEVLATANNNPLVGEPLEPRLYTSLALLLRAVRLILVPLNLSADYGYAEILPIRSPWHPDVLAGGALLVALLAAAWRLRHRAPAVAAAALLLLVGWASLSHVLVPLPTIFAERLLYLPAMALPLALASLVVPWQPASHQPAAREVTPEPADAPAAGAPEPASSVPPAGTHHGARQRLLAAGVLALLGLNAARGVARDAEWRDDLTLFRSTVQTSPRSARAWLNLGAALQRAERHAAALRALDRAAAIAPGWASIHSLRGVSLFRLGRLREAEQAMRLAVRLDPRSRRARRNLAELRRALRTLGHPRGSLRPRRQPEHGQAHPERPAPPADPRRGTRP